MDKFVIKCTKPSKAQTPSPKKNSPKKVSEYASTVSTKSTLPVQVNSPTKDKGKQSARKRYYRWTDQYLIQYNWLIKKSDGKIYCKACERFRSSYKAQQLELYSGWSGNDQGYKEEYLTRHQNNEI